MILFPKLFPKPHQKRIFEWIFIQKSKEKHDFYTFFLHNCRVLVGRGGFEPPKSKTSDLQSDPFGHSGICPYLVLLWSRWLDSNPQPADYKSAALPIELHRQLLASRTNHDGWCLGAESNHRQADFQSAALPTELPRHLWRPRTGSNRRPPAWQAGALTNWATGPQI